MIGNICDTFSKIVINNPKKSITDCYNYLLKCIDDDKLGDLNENYRLVIKVGEDIRNAPDEIKKMIA